MEKKKFCITIAIVVLIFSIVTFITASTIEYYFAKSTYRIPVLALKSESVSKQYTIYRGVFYKVYKCYSDLIVVKSLKDEPPYCLRIVRYTDDGYYINYNGLKISKKDLQLIFDKSITFKEIDNLTTKDQVKDYVYIADQYQRNVHKVYETTKEKDGILSIDVFQEFVQINNYGDYEWRYQFNNPKYYKCFKNGMYKEYENETCTGEWKELKYSEKWCKLAKNNSISSIQEAYKNNCN